MVKLISMVGRFREERIFDTVSEAAKAAVNDFYRHSIEENGVVVWEYNRRSA